MGRLTFAVGLDRAQKIRFHSKRFRTQYDRPLIELSSGYNGPGVYINDCIDILPMLIPSGKFE